MSMNGTFEQSSRKFSQRRIMNVQWKIREKFILAWKKNPFLFSGLSSIFLALWRNFFTLSKMHSACLEEDFEAFFSENCSSIVFGFSAKKMDI